VLLTAIKKHIFIVASIRFFCIIGFSRNERLTTDLISQEFIVDTIKSVIKLEFKTIKSKRFR